MTKPYVGDLSIFTTEELEDELYRRNKPKKPVKPELIENPDYTELKNLCIEYIERIENKDCSIDDRVDTEHYIFEAAMETFFGIEIWNYLSSEYWEEED